MSPGPGPGPEARCVLHYRKKGLDASLLHVYACIAVPVVEISSTAQATRTCSL
ncbi:hypothetical protein MGG_16235 [Pyricularia oryzae 70-15]|uniref:Uncharacterized protein n=4 Tax=Pyricularia oryzae TaxID=318829 RepID=G4MNX7_PYRO7|nr:uncharacterized protein MGG_16235 [Pyricularia oryzae 70-15]ELQ36407.1 hypothetical protein OOU_Y34scaffold00663g7 [Pyricularia oryzae Y34]KAI7920342.1 hypothetical protein M9X92_005948 [Pyricularia oryzae]EHA57134.1 hypothetical protein MGG_16235 [Pyricularia oryzae 70-15]KAI7927452.1 hypothetical protein M0657_003274 [Pyricularia oryzae]QBZ54399.1 hypothetical protein PoMZ_10098 [Pyricularia oryzae]